MDPLTKDIIQSASWIVGILGGLLLAWVAIRQLKSNVEQRKNEQRWRQAQAAKEAINDIHSNSWGRNCVTMLDWSEGKHRINFEEKQSVEISYAKDVIPALGKPYRECSETDQNVVYCFDWFFYFIDRIEHSITTSLIQFGDVEDVFRQYAHKIKEHRETYEAFMKAHGYHLAVAFWKRYDT